MKYDLETNFLIIIENIIINLFLVTRVFTTTSVGNEN
jgi:hypothetical protein